MFINLKRNSHFVKDSTVKKIVIILTVFLILLSMPLLAKAKKKKNPECSTCKEISRQFEEGLKKTAKSGYGGGNTNWEEKSLGSFAKSETRFVEITEEYLCKDGSKECHLMKERYEDHLEAFWFNQYREKDNVDFFEWFCITSIEACCANNTYGPECSPCPGDPQKPCSGNGFCDGEGTRVGTGECKCNAGYHGNMCNECSDGYFEEDNDDTQVTCKACDISCKSICSEAGPKGCDECKDGWTQTEEEGCKDINECTLETATCNEDQYCLNTQGSYTCMSCDKSCKGCTGSGDGKCKECSEGFVQSVDKCKDHDECAADSSLCTGENERCVNEPGTYSCSCKDGYQRNSDEKCVKKPKDDDEGDDDVEEDSENAQDEMSSDSTNLKEEL